MKKAFTLLFFFYSIILSAQAPAFLLGDGIRVRDEASVNGKELRKFYGLTEVEVLEVGTIYDGLGKTDNNCEKHPWIKIKWAKDSIGWVYGKYVFTEETKAQVIAPDLSFFVLSDQCFLIAYKNYSYPSYNDVDGLTGCDDNFTIFVFNSANGSYTPINDKVSKKDQTHMVLSIGEGGGEQVTSLRMEKSTLVIQTQISYQDGGANGVYLVKRTGYEYEVTKYTKAQDK